MPSSSLAISRKFYEPDEYSSILSAFLAAGRRWRRFESTYSCVSVGTEWEPHSGTIRRLDYSPLSSGVDELRDTARLSRVLERLMATYKTQRFSILSALRVSER